jgi:glutaminyl-peptide cyclotransferase
MTNNKWIMILLLGLLCSMNIGNCVVASAETECFNGQKAFAHLSALVGIGPRPSDSPGAVRAQEYIMDGLARQGLEVREQSFDAYTPIGPKRMKNIIGIVPGKSGKILIIGAHYETKLINGIQFVGANDSASGTAILLEISRCLKGLDNQLTIWLVFFDGEEAFARWSETDGLYGSKHMVKLLKESGEIENVKAMLLLDMVGDSHLSIESETYSTAWLRKIVWTSAKRLGYPEQFTDNLVGIQDDHIPFVEQGIPALDIIDFHYGPGSRTNKYWHTERDNLEHVSPLSLKIVGDVVLESIPEITLHIQRN